MDEAKTILIDCDGVLTDGKIYMSGTGKEMFKAFHSRDVRALRELVAHGYDVVIITASSSCVTKSFAHKTGVHVHTMRDKSKVIEKYFNFVAIGDDVWDLPMLEKAVKAFCPSDADQKILHHRSVQVLKTAGGAGVIAELARKLLEE